MIYSTYFGGASGDQGRSIAVGIDGSVYVGGNAGSSFPVTQGAFQTTPGQQGDAFLMKLNPAGSQIVYATLLAGARSDVVSGVEVDELGFLYATGHTASDNFPVTTGAAQAVRPATGNNNDAFVLKLNTLGTGLVYSTLFAGSEDEQASAIAVKDGFAYIPGASQSTNLPTTAGVLQPALKGTYDAFLVCVNQNGSAFIFATYLGGTNLDEGWGIAVDKLSDVYVTGATLATDFPTVNPIQPTRRNGEDGFVAKVNSNGTALVYSTYLGSSISDHMNSIAVDRHGAAYVVGQSSNDFPTTPDAHQPQTAGAIDLVFFKVAADGRRLLYSTFLGGAGTERSGQDSGDAGGNTIAERNCNAYIGGHSNSNNYPVVNALQTLRAGNDDAIFTRIDTATNLNEPRIDCAAGFLAPLRPLVETWSPRSIATLFGANLAGATVASPAVGPNGLITTIAAGTCIEINGKRAPMYYTSPTQLNFQVPVDVGLGWVRVFVIRNCDQPSAVRSEPLFVRIQAVVPGFFIFPLTDPAIAAVNDTQSVGAPAAVIVGPAGAGAPYVAASAGDIVSAYFTGGGTTNPPLRTGQIPGGVFNLTGSVSVTLGGVTLLPGDIFYAGGSPCCAGLDQLTFRIPTTMHPGNHKLIVTIGGVPSADGPFISVR